jgi:hypothetical protein
MSEQAQTGTGTETPSTPATDTPAAGGGAAAKTGAESTPTSIMGASDEGADKSKADAKAGGEGDAKPDDKPYALEVPKELEQHVDKAVLEKFTAFAKAEGLTAEHASKALKFHLEHTAAATKSQYEAVDKQAKAWLDEVKADKELGGAKFDETKADVGRALTKFADKSLREELDAMGISNHPGLVRMMAKVGAMLREDSGGIPGAGAGRARTTEWLDYGNA